MELLLLILITITVYLLRTSNKPFAYKLPKQDFSKKELDRLAKSGILKQVEHKKYNFKNLPSKRKG